MMNRVQQGRGGEMVKDIQLIVADALSEGAVKRWRFRGQSVPLAAEGVVRRDAAILSGTPAGVVFRSPGWTDIACRAIYSTVFGRTATSAIGSSSASSTGSGGPVSIFNRATS